MTCTITPITCTCTLDNRDSRPSSRRLPARPVRGLSVPPRRSGLGGLGEGAPVVPLAGFVGGRQSGEL